MRVRDERRDELGCTSSQPLAAEAIVFRSVGLPLSQHLELLVERPLDDTLADTQVAGRETTVEALEPCFLVDLRDADGCPPKGRRSR